MYRKVFSLLVFLIGLLFVAGCTNRTTTISGTIGKQMKLLYSNPGLTVCDDVFLDTLMSDDQGRFTLKLDLKERRFMIIKMSGYGNKYLIPVLPGENYDISIGKDNELSVDGPNREGIELYQSMMNYDPWKMDWSIFKSNTISRGKVIERIKQKDLAQFKELLDDKKITSSFYKLIEDDRDCFYASVAASLYLRDMLSIYRASETGGSILTEENTMNRLQHIFGRYKPDDKNLMKSPSWTEYALFLYIEQYQQYLKKHIDRSNIENLINSEQHFSFWFEQIKQSYANNGLEEVLALCIHAKGGPEVEPSIPAFQYFKEKYPVSPYLPYFQERMNRATAFYEGDKLDSPIRFIESGDSINNLPGLISLLKGKKLYVDIWGSFCGPCRKQLFQYKDSLEIILKQNDVTPLYISLDGDDLDKQWRAIVYSYDIKGIHFRVNRAFENDLNRLYRDGKNEYGERSFSIPKYMFIDESGNIVDKDFKKPAEIVSEKCLFN